MRRFVSYTGIILLALLVSGWSIVLAATLCPHAGMNQALPMAEDHSGCRTKLEAVEMHHSSSHHEAAHGAQMKTVAVPHLQGSEHAALGQMTGTCAHCVGQSELPVPPASVRELTLQQRDAGKPVVHTTTLTVPPSVVSMLRFTPTQHSPPGVAGRKHLIFSVFLI
jgi:hypothetical protein